MKTAERNILEEALKTLKWMWDNMKVADPNFQSDAFNIPANTITQIENYLSNPPSSVQGKTAEEKINLEILKRTCGGCKTIWTGNDRCPTCCEKVSLTSPIQEAGDKIDWEKINNEHMDWYLNLVFPEQATPQDHFEWFKGCPEFKQSTPSLSLQETKPDLREMLDEEFPIPVLKFDNVHQEITLGQQAIVRSIEKRRTQATKFYQAGLRSSVSKELVEYMTEYFSHRISEYGQAEKSSQNAEYFKVQRVKYERFINELLNLKIK